MNILLSYDEIKNFASGKVDYFSLWCVNCSKVHVIVKVRKFFMTHTINVYVSLKEIKENRIYLHYDGNISLLAKAALKWGWINFPSFVLKKNRNDITVNLRLIPSFPRNLELQNITFYDKDVHLIFNLKK